MVPTYPYERRPKALDGWLNWWYGRNRLLEQAPVVLLTGAGVSIPAGVPGLALPEYLTLSGGIRIASADLVPSGGVGPGDVLDLESLLIVADVLRSLPRRVVHEGIPGAADTASAEEQLETHRAVLGATVRMALPRMAGGTALSPAFVDGLIDRLVALDRRHHGKVLDHLSEAITNGIFEACLAIRRDTLVPLYAPLLKRLVSLLARARAPLVIPVFTTNYDEAFGFLSDELRSELSDAVGRAVVVADGTTPWPGHPHWRMLPPDGYRRLRPSEKRALTVAVFYLHGSIRWFLSAEAKPWFELQVADAEAARAPGLPRFRALLMPNAQKVLWGKSHVGISRALAPEAKDPYRPGAPYYMVRLAYRFFERCLGQAGAVLASGYSFRDSDARDLLTEAWRRPRSRHLVILDPHPDDVVSRLGPGARERVTAVAGRFEPASFEAVENALAATLLNDGPRAEAGRGAAT